MLNILTLLGLVFTTFFLFLGSFLATLLEDVVSADLVRYFEDVRALNPGLTPTEIVVGTLLSYFVSVALFVVLLRVSHELKKRRDVYDLEGAVAEGLVFGVVALVTGFLLRIAGLQGTSNLVIPITVFVSEVRRDVRSAVLVSALILAVFFVSHLVITSLRPTEELLVPLFYVSLALVPSIIVAATRKLI